MTFSFERGDYEIFITTTSLLWNWVAVPKGTRCFSGSFKADHDHSLDIEWGAWERAADKAFEAIKRHEAALTEDS